MGDKLGEELINAARTGNVEAVQCCIEKGKLFRLCSQYKRGYTPLMVAAQRGHIECVELMLRHGADVDTKEWQGCTARDLAEQNGHTGIVQLFSRDKPPLLQRLSLPSGNLGLSHSNLPRRVADLENKQNVTTTKVSDLEARCGDLETSQGQLAAALKDVQAQVKELHTQDSLAEKAKKNQGSGGGIMLYNRIRSNYQQFESNLIATDHMAFLFAKHVIEVEDMEEIDALPSKQKQTKLLMRKLMGKPDKRWVYAFKESLDEVPSCTRLAELLND